jgi:Zn-dependent protease with chaperone function
LPGFLDNGRMKIGLVVVLALLPLAWTAPARAQEEPEQPTGDRPPGEGSAYRSKPSLLDNSLRLALHGLGARSRNRRDAVDRDDLERFARHETHDDDSPSMLALAWWLFVAWLLGMAILFVLGLVLSAMTLRASARPPAVEQAHARGSAAALRRVYATVLWLCCAYYYVSIPFALATVVLGGGGLIYLLFAAGHVPIRLVLLIGLIVIVTIWATLKSLFVRGSNEAPGKQLALAEHPKLRAALDEVAERVGTRPVDSVYLTPGTEVAVTERGGLTQQLRGKSERCLILGVAVLDGFDVAAFKSVLAHEYGHFVNRDTAGGGFALQVRRSLFSMAFGLARGGAATWMNPAWWFVRGFHRVFLHISQGASRLQEVLADRWAAVLYGAQPFEAGLRHVIVASARFDAHVNATLKEVTDQKLPLANLYHHPLQQTLDVDVLRGQIDAALNRPASPFDSHPRPIDRIAWVKALAGTTATATAAAGDAWTLFGDREQCERDMTAEVRARVREQFGIEIRATALPAEA